MISPLREIVGLGGGLAFILGAGLVCPRAGIAALGAWFVVLAIWWPWGEGPHE